MWTDRKVKEELERCVATACLVAQLDPRDYPVKLMGKKKQDKNQSLKYAYYVQIQNFDSLTSVKKQKTDDFYRFTFRVILFRERQELLYEIVKWIPSYKSVENTTVVFRSDEPDRYQGHFIDHLTTVMKFYKYRF
jgi:hypothetical protein